ncbi:MAG TPA: DUF2171 domain-containing protein [Sphingobium sp.]|nr:DUF2171 domain-containing protein [Sphingobium sp.]
MFEKSQIKEHMEVRGPADEHVGTVDSLAGDVLKLTRSDSSDGVHHYIDLKWVDRIEDGRLYLKGDAQVRTDSSHARPHPSATRPEKLPLFGTSGHGTGMGGSGFNG